MHEKQEKHGTGMFKSGLIPYFYDEVMEEYKFLFMVASDPKFGGLKPMISKGTIEPNEDPLPASIREAEEELGLRPHNLLEVPFEIYDEYVTLRSSEYWLKIYAAEIDDPKDFGDFEFETAYTVWMTYDQFMDGGRRDHKIILDKLIDKLNDMATE